MTVKEKHDELIRRYRKVRCMEFNDVLPVVSMKRGYPAFVAHIYRIRKENEPSEWWLVEVDEDNKPVDVRQICQY